MEITVSGGTGTASTATAAADAALLDADVGNYNLLVVSSVIPADATVRAVDTQPDLGEPGELLTVVRARASVPPGSPDQAVAALGWATGPGAGIFYEATGTDPDAVETTVREGLTAGRSRRSWEFTAERVRVVTADPAPTDHVESVAVGVYGTGRQISQYAP